MSEGLAQFVLNRLGEDESLAQLASRYNTGHWRLMCKCWVDMGVDKGEEDIGQNTFSTDSDPFAAEHIVRWSPDRVLEQIQLWVHLVEKYLRHLRGGSDEADELRPVVIEVARFYRDHQNYDPAWDAS